MTDYTAIRNSGRYVGAMPAAESNILTSTGYIALAAATAMTAALSVSPQAPRLAQATAGFIERLTAGTEATAPKQKFTAEIAPIRTNKGTMEVVFPGLTPGG